MSTYQPVIAFDPHAAFATFQALLSSDGFTFKKTKDYTGESEGKPVRETRWLSTNEERGVKLVVIAGLDSSGANLQILAHVRDSRGRYIKRWLNRSAYIGVTNYAKNPGDVDGIINALVSEIRDLRGDPVTNAPLQTIDDLADFPPLHFDRPYVVQGQVKADGSNIRPGRWHVKHAYDDVIVRGVAVIKDDLKVSLEGSSTPNTECWFFITGSSAGPSNGNPDIIVTERDGKLVYYPVRNNKVTNDLKPKNTYIDYETITELDKMLIEQAIAAYLAKL
jgi:hypothetical protein